MDTQGANHVRAYWSLSSLLQGVSVQYFGPSAGDAFYDAGRERRGKTDGGQTRSSDGSRSTIKTISKQEQLREEVLECASHSRTTMGTSGSYGPPHQNLAEVRAHMPRWAPRGTLPETAADQNIEVDCHGLVPTQRGDDQVEVTSLGTVKDETPKQADVVRINCKGASGVGAICGGWLDTG